MTLSTMAQPTRLIQVWFGTHPIVNYESGEDTAAIFGQAMKRRLASIRVTDCSSAVAPTPQHDPEDDIREM